MRLGRLQININPKLPKIDRKLQLEHFYTFKDGTNIFTYKMEDLSKISGRYLDQVKSNLNFMLQYAAGPEQVKTFAGNIEKEAMTALEGKQDRTKALVKIAELADAMPKLQDYVDDLHANNWYSLYEMFFVLEDEQECLFTPKMNARKRELLKAEGEEAQEVFFSMVRSVIIYFSDTYREDILSSMVKERDLASLAASLTVLTDSPSMRSQSQDGQELELKSSGIIT